MNIEKIANKVVRSLRVSRWSDPEADTGSPNYGWEEKAERYRYWNEYDDVESLLGSFKSQLKQFVPEGDYLWDFFIFVVEFSDADQYRRQRSGDWEDEHGYRFELDEVYFVYWHVTNQNPLGLKKVKLPRAFQEAVFEHFMNERYEDVPGYRG
jgi:hypothetical protein